MSQSLCISWPEYPFLRGNIDCDIEDYIEGPTYVTPSVASYAMRVPVAATLCDTKPRSFIVKGGLSTRVWLHFHTDLDILDLFIKQYSDEFRGNVFF